MKKYTDGKDAERVKKGQPPSVPQTRPAYSLGPEVSVPPSVPTCEQKHDDYEMAGVMQESDDEDDDIAAIDSENEMSDDDDCYFVFHGSRKASSRPADRGRVPEIRGRISERLDAVTDYLHDFDLNGTLPMGLHLSHPLWCPFALRSAR